MTEPITKKTYQIQDDNHSTITKTVQRNHLIECHPEEQVLPAKIEENVPMDRRHENLLVRCLERRIQKLNNP